MGKKIITIAHFSSILIAILLWLYGCSIAFSHRFFILPKPLYRLSLLMLGAVLIGAPILAICILISYCNKSVQQRSIILICLAVQVVLTMLLMALYHATALPETNKVLYAKPVSVEQMSQYMDKKQPGMYFITTWAESGTVTSEETYVAAWLDFSTQYDITTEMFYFYSPDKAEDYPQAVTQFMEKQKISQLPAAVYISNDKTVKIFNGISWGPILQADDENSMAFKLFLSENFDEKSAQEQ